ncbi:hypothetical protein ACI6QG_09130 [Roseococcus sp. DSY-14]|uniref:hypothetical protein n=1 Tax=Roseococcus sp. DSY-14 TaxID=3369650 RepID=UPI00387B6793
MVPSPRPSGPSLRGAAATGLLLAALLLPGAARAQMETREGIALQNQILQLRQEMEQMRRGGGPVAPPVASRGGGGGELTGQLLERVQRLEEEVSRQRGRADVLENQNARLRAELEKLQGDIEFRLSRAEGGTPPRGGAATAAPPAGPPTTSTGAPPPRTPELALREGQAALARRDYAAAEAAAREAIGTRGGAGNVNAQLLLGDALAGRRDFGNAAIAYNEAYTRARTGPRAPEAMTGLAGAFLGLNSRREACETLGELRSQFPRLSGPVAERAEALRRQGRCG